MDRLKVNSNVDDIAPVTGVTDGGESAFETTGRYLVLFNENALDQGVSVLKSISGLRVSTARDFEASAVNFDEIGDDVDALVLPELGAAALSAEPDQINRLSAEVGEDRSIVAMEPERIVYATATPTPALDLPEPTGSPSLTSPIETSPSTASYLHGYKDAVDSLVNRLTDGRGIMEEAVVYAEDFEAAARRGLTWGLAATQVDRSRFSGRGIRVAVLDTGMDLNHPDFAGRSINSQSFIRGQAVQDGHGHGTHCIGTACGPKSPAGRSPRYGVAYESDIFAGKVLSNRGSGSDGGILAGINWAIANSCQVISMSLGAPTRPGQPYSQIYEMVARRAMWRGSLIIAAAGNGSDRRRGIINPVSHPANAPSIIAVGAVDSRLRIANFSNRGINPTGGRIDIVGPGVSVHSSWPMPRRYRTIDGTSMATPGAAGIAALFAQQSPTVRGALLWHPLVTNARQLPIYVFDDGWGIVQAP